MTPGHVFVALADLTRLACDCVLVPSSQWLEVEAYSWELVDDLPCTGYVLDVAAPTGFPEGRVRCFSVARPSETVL